MAKHCTVFLARHGETDWNVAGKFQGATDIPLNLAGEHQCYALKEKFKGISPDAVFSSDLSRAKRTAEIVTGHPHIITTPLLRERTAGSLEGTFSIDILKLCEGALPLQATKEELLGHEAHPEIESYGRVYNRLQQFLQSLMPRFAGKTVFVATHGGVIRSLLIQMSHVPGKRWMVHNCGYLQLALDGDTHRILHKENVSLV